MAYFFARHRFFLSWQDKEESAKKEIQRAAFVKSKQNPTHL